MKKMVGTVSRGIRTPIIRSGDDLVNIIADSVISPPKEEIFEIIDRNRTSTIDTIVPKAHNNYGTVEDIATDIKNKFSQK